MKTEINGLFPQKNDNTKKVQDVLPRLSEEAFYLIALADLLKKEFGEASLKQFLVPAGLPIYKYNITR